MEMTSNISRDLGNFSTTHRLTDKIREVMSHLNVMRHQMVNLDDTLHSQ